MSTGDNWFRKMVAFWHQIDHRCPCGKDLRPSRIVPVSANISRWRGKAKRHNQTAKLSENGRVRAGEAATDELHRVACHAPKSAATSETHEVIGGVHQRCRSLDPDRTRIQPNAMPVRIWCRGGGHAGHCERTRRQLP